MSQIPFLFAVVTFVSILLGIASYYYRRAHRASRTAWMMLLGRLRKIDRDKFTAVALDLLERRQEGQQLDPQSIFEMIGGMDGLDALEQNCDVLVDLAAYVQRWYPEALELTEDLRVNARQIKWHIGRLRGAMRTGHFYDQFPIYAQRAVAAYYLMTQSLLVLYAGVQVPEWAELKNAL